MYCVLQADVFSLHTYRWSSDKRMSLDPQATTNLKIHTSLAFVFIFLQYYEMSYGLNVEMHKQVGVRENESNTWQS